MKYDFLPIDHNNVELSQTKLKGEVSPETEWSIYDDHVVDHKGSWWNVVNQCVDLMTYPTILFYEKLDQKEPVPEFIPGN